MRATRYALAAAIVVVWAGCLVDDTNGDGTLRLACLGDSNTQREFSVPQKWCEYAAADLGIPASNVAVLGATACENGPAYPWPSALEELPNALATAPDLLLVALGTNDIRHFGTAATAFADCLRALIAASPVPVVIGTIPPLNTGTAGEDRKVREYNNQIGRLGVPTIDFTSGAAGELADGVHVTDAAQHERAARTVAVLLAP